MKLYDLTQKARRAGGDRMPPARKKSLFGADSRLARNVITLTSDQKLIDAVRHGVLTDHRVAEEMRKIEPFAAHVILAVETRLGRKLPRERAGRLVQKYITIKNERLALEATLRFLSSVAQPKAALSSPAKVA